MDRLFFFLGALLHLPFDLSLDQIGLFLIHLLETLELEIVPAKDGLSLLIVIEVEDSRHARVNILGH
jgi:hypothetical protein